MTFRPFTDAGHGGGNTGTHDADFVEKHVVLDIEGKLHSSLTAAPFYVGRSRRDDSEMTQGERGHVSMRAGVHLVLSIHVNDCHEPARGGAQLYVGERNRRTFGIANDWAGLWTKLFHVGGCQVIKTYNDPGTDADDWIENPRSIIYAHAADVILLELGFRRNEHDRAILMSENGREQIASMLRWCLFRAAQYYGS